MVVFFGAGFKQKVTVVLRSPVGLILLLATALPSAYTYLQNRADSR